MHVRRTCLMFLAIALICYRTYADDWRQFRGPGSNGVIQDIKLPEVWGLDSNIKWKVGIPGEGWSAPIVVGQKVFVTTAVSSGQKDKNSEHVWKVMCLDASTCKKRMPLWMIGELAVPQSLCIG